ncbi:MAG: hypothetical protein AAFO51_03230 [Pseudomonadota bacterium]
MSHVYPLAATVEDALSEDTPRARTRYEADALAGEGEIRGLETEWVTPDEKALEAFVTRAETGRDLGFVQKYEDASGSPVFAVTFWRIGPGVKPKPTPAPAKPDPAAGKDHTDELYFRKDKPKRKRKKRARSVDPRQLDLFSGPNQQGYERRDPENPQIILTDEEGDGTTFGG